MEELTLDQVLAAIEAPGVLNGKVVPQEPEGWELHPALHDAEAEATLDTLRFPSLNELRCPKCGSDDMAAFATSATCLQVCSWRGKTEEAHECGRTFYRAQAWSIVVGENEFGIPGGVSAFGRTEKEAKDKFTELVQRAAVTIYAEHKSGESYEDKQIAESMEKDTE